MCLNTFLHLITIFIIIYNLSSALRTICMLRQNSLELFYVLPFNYDMFSLFGYPLRTIILHRELGSLFMTSALMYISLSTFCLSLVPAETEADEDFSLALVLSTLNNWNFFKHLCASYIYTSSLLSQYI